MFNVIQITVEVTHQGSVILKQCWLTSTADIKTMLANLITLADFLCLEPQDHPFLPLDGHH